ARQCRTKLWSVTYSVNRANASARFTVHLRIRLWYGVGGIAPDVRIREGARYADADGSDGAARGPPRGRPQRLPPGAAGPAPAAPGRLGGMRAAPSETSFRDPIRARAPARALAGARARIRACPPRRDSCATAQRPPECAVGRWAGLVKSRPSRCSSAKRTNSH